MSITLEPLAGFGVRIGGIDGKTLLEEHPDVFVDAFHQHAMVLLNDTALDDDTGVKLTELLGPVSHVSPNMRDGRKFSFISNQHEEGALRDGELLFHADHTFFPQPLKAISLYALAVPSQGGETHFSDGRAAWDRLPVALKQRVQGLRARHVATYGVAQNKRPVRGENKADFSAVHPIAWPHPDQDRSVLFVSRLLTECIEGLGPVQSDALLEELFAYIEDPAHLVRHRWRVGDYLVWDNRALQHARTEFDPTEKRALRRVPIAS